MKVNKLIIFTDCFPLKTGEFFIENEVKVLSKRFTEIVVFSREKENKNYTIVDYPNIKVFFIGDITISCSLHQLLFELLKNYFLSEVFFVLKNNTHNFISCMKIMIVEIQKSISLYNYLVNLNKDNKLILDEYLFYSYWHDYRTLTFSYIKRKGFNVIAVSRAHGWDVYAERHKPKYLPFKRFILDSIDSTFVVSDSGKKELEKYTKLKNKIIISKLGVINERSPIFEKEQSGFLICSCSNLVSIKRVELIIKVLSLLNLKQLKWVHFGDGPQMDFLVKLSHHKLDHIKFYFKGYCPNKKILNFYSQNYVDLFINLSESEGIPVSIMEALSAGIPVIATDVGGTGEAVNSDNGFLVKKDFDINELADIIKGYLNSPLENQQKYRINAYQFWKENFDAEKNYNEFAEELLKLTEF